MNYAWAYKYILAPIHTVFEIGSRDLLDACGLASHFDCSVVAFECNPDCLAVCANAPGDPRVRLVPKAVSNVDGPLTFHSFDLEKYDNIGASSLFEIDFSNRSMNDPDRNKTDVQKIITVNSTRLDTFCAAERLVPDALFLDIQEGELLALQGAGDILAAVKYICFEGSSTATYKGGCSAYDVHCFLTSKGFVHISNNGITPDTAPSQSSQWSFNDYLYIRL